MSHKTARKYSRSAHFFDFFECPIEYMVFRKLRSEVVSMAEGHVLEIGVGTGKNLAYYSSGVDVQAIDFSHGMLKMAVGKSIPDGCKVNFCEMDVQTLEFEENRFDCSISTFVFCTVPDAKQGLSELYRVLKPGGKAIFLEHQKSRNSLINIFLYMMEPMMRLLFGTSMIRETQDYINASGLIIDSVENKVLDVVRLIVAHKPVSH